MHPDNTGHAERTAVTIRSAFLPHNDPDASLAFYRDLLGFEIRDDLAYDGQRWLTVAPPDSTVTIVLEPPAAQIGVTTAERDMIAEMMAKGTYAALVLTADDLDTVHARLLAGGAELVHAPLDPPHGPRCCAFRDPAGNLIRIDQR
ncbi:VOC family protein [Glycomyces sp. NPDC046736]|uniref:VOC family protein n=1 Tax=Glycomyces sp. NPDC046736 TaxID=3155615 RepID=UPI0033EE05C3